MKLYTYHPDTGEFVEEFFAELDPLEAKLSIAAGREPDKYLIPAHCVDTAPPSTVGTLRAYWDHSVQDWYLADTAPEPEEDNPEVDYLQQPMDRLTFWLAAAEISMSKRSVLARIDGLEDSPDKFRAYAYVEEAVQYRRYDPLLIAFAEAEGIVGEQLDTLWVWALTPQ